MNSKSHDQIQKLALTALFAALCYVIFTFLQIKIPHARRRCHFPASWKCLLRSGRTASRRRLRRTGRSCRHDDRRPDGPGLYYWCAENICPEVLYRPYHRTGSTQNRKDQ